MESVKGTANQTSLEAEPLTHEPWSIHSAFEFIAAIQKKTPINQAVPRHLTALFTVSSEA